MTMALRLYDGNFKDFFWSDEADRFFTMDDLDDA
jgi:hypothetical protein